MSHWPTVDEIESEIAAGRLRALTLNLYDLNQGYSLTVPGANCADSATDCFSYQQNELIDCVERGHVPWFLTDLFEQCPAQLFYKNCMACHVCDYRTPASPSRLLILRPSPQSLLNDLARLQESCPDLTDAQRRSLECKFWKMVSPPIDMETDRKGTQMDSGAYRSLRRPFSSRRRLRQSVESSCLYSRLSLSSHIIQCSFASQRPSLKERIQMFKTDTKPAATGGQWKPMAAAAAAKTPDELATRKWSVAEQKRRERYPNESSLEHLQLIEEISVDMASDQGSQEMVHTTRIVISKHKRNATYWGFLCLEGNPSVENGPFLLGVEWDAKMYVLQYLEMITEGGRKQPISVTRNSPGKPPHVVTAKTKNN